MDQKQFSSVGEAFIYIQDTLMKLILSSQVYREKHSGIHV